MNARFLVFSVVVFLGLGAARLAGAEPQASPRVYELTIGGQTVEIKESEAVEFTIEGKSVRATVRLKPIQHYATEAIEFDYDRSLSLRDDFRKENRGVTLVHGSSASLVITELGGDDVDGPKPTLARLAEQMETRFKRGVCKDFKKSPDEPAPLKRAGGFTTALTYKDEDDEEQTCRIYALESKGKRFSVVVQFGVEEKDIAEALAKITLDSIVGKGPSQ